MGFGKYLRETEEKRVKIILKNTLSKDLELKEIIYNPKSVYSENSDGHKVNYLLVKGWRILKILNGTRVFLENGDELFTGEIVKINCNSNVLEGEVIKRNKVGIKIENKIYTVEEILEKGWIISK